MDQLTLEAQSGTALSQNVPMYAGLVAVALIVLVVLVGVVIIQNRKIKEMQRPKYGFLGKSLSAFFLLAIVLGGIGLVYYNNTTNTNEFKDVSADSSLDIDIIITQVDNIGKIYQLNAIPTVNDDEWGGSSEYSFDVYWTVTNGDVNTQIELALNQDNTGGVRLNLKNGIYKVKATAYVGSRNVEKEVTLEVE